MAKQDLTVDKIREQNRLRAKKYYEAHKKQISKKRKERRAMDKKLS